MPEEPIKVHFTQGDGKGWALDEDLRQIRGSLAGMVAETGPSRAEVIHAPFWQNLGMVAPDILERAFVVAHADNPPFFYLKQPEFLNGQQWVDLWVARSQEALNQFRRLGLSAIHIPYTIDPGLFFPIHDRKKIRREFGIPEEAYVIANFHRDTEGADLRTPKVQKNPEFMVMILRRLKAEGRSFHVLLAGPRRHWIREALKKEGIPFTFVGKEVAGDDFGINILDRKTLNRLYNASDLYLIPSRWEGGPQSAMEAAASRCKLASVPVGVAADILQPASLFRTADQAASAIGSDIAKGSLVGTIEPQFQAWKARHTTEALQASLQDLYRLLPDMISAKAGRLSAPRRGTPFRQAFHTIRRRFIPAKLPLRVRWNHLAGRNEELDKVMEGLRGMLASIGVKIGDDGILEIAGWPLAGPHGGKILQWIVPGMPTEAIIRNAMLVAPSVQDIVNLREEGFSQSALVLPVITAASAAVAPLVVLPDDKSASLRVWEALCAGCPVIYPADSAYYEQVFHAGIPYEAGDNPTGRIGEASSMRDELRALAHVPSEAAIARLLKKLLKATLATCG